MVKWTSLPAIYLWIAASGTVIFYGIFKPDIVLPNVEAFIALIAIIGGYASKSYDNILELWKAEQTVETDLHPEVIKSNQKVMEAKAEHDRTIAVMEIEHKHTLAMKQQEHEHCLAHEKQKAELGVSADAHTKED
jgi:hypothetical protein